MKKLVIGLGGILLGTMVVLVSATWYAFGSGADYPDLTQEPTLSAEALESAVVSDRPVGNAAVSASGRIFYTIHPESKPDYPMLYEWKNGKAVPYQSIARQKTLFESPLGLAIDAKNRLWVIDPGNHGTGKPSISAFELATNKLVHRHEFSADIAPLGSFLQDLQVSSDGNWVYIADVGFWPKRPAIIAYNVADQSARRILEKHESVYPQNYLIRNQIRDMSYLGGILQMQTGIDGIALSRDDDWLYYAAMNHRYMYRIPTSALQNFSVSKEQIANKVEIIGEKPLNDGLSIDNERNIFITDVEHQAVVKMKPDGRLETVLKDKRIRWADSLSFGPDGWLYLADSAIPHLVLQSPEHIADQAPYYIWRFKPGSVGLAGQ